MRELPVGGVEELLQLAGTGVARLVLGGLQDHVQTVQLLDEARLWRLVCLVLL